MTVSLQKKHYWRVFAMKSLLLPLGCLLLAAGCATGPGKKTAPKYVFFPPAPEQARLQFLVSFSDEKDITAPVGKFAAFVTGAKPTPEPILKPYGAVMFGNELLVCDTGARAIDILDLTRRSMRRFAPGGLGKFGTPINVAVDRDGTRYITDTGRNQVLIFSSDDAFLGAVGSGDESMRPTGVALTSDRLYVSDLKTHCVRVYSKTDRKFLFTVPPNPGAPEEQEPGKLYMPVNVAVDQAGHLYVSDTASCRILVYDADGKHLRSFGTRGDLPGQFARPKGLAVDRENRIYVVDAATQVCQIFAPDGKLLLFFGEPEGSSAPLNLPASVSLDSEHVSLFKKYAAPGFVLEHLVVITNQYGDRKVSVYGFGHRS